MLFNSYQFVIYFIVVFLLYYFLPYRFRWLMLLGFSYFFYMYWEPRLIILIIFLTAVHYTAALQIEKINKTDGKKNKKAILNKKVILITSIVTSLLILFVFKYFNFFINSIKDFSDYFGITLNIKTWNLILPMGISFYTFQTLSYTLDVYHGRILPERHLGYFALYVVFFPQLVAGPIERADSLIPQLKEKHDFCYERVVYGLKLMAIGYFKKMVIADTLAKGVDKIYNNLGDYSGIILAVATVMFAFQIYCDFSGYSDIAIGCANTMGIRLMKNFDSPYLAKDIGEFWRRWHISLSTWFRDYIYIPLGGNRKGKWKTYRNLMITFLLSGLWHGANWTYVAWGGLHGCFQIIEHIVKRRVKIRQSDNFLFRSVKIVLTFSLVCFAWIFFRANDISDAFYVIENMFVGITSPRDYLMQGICTFLDFTFIGKVLILEFLILMLIDIYQSKYDLVMLISEKSVFVRWTIYVLFCATIVILASRGTATAFIYFQF